MSNIVISKTIAGTSYQVTIFTTNVEEIIAKSLTSFTPPQSTAKQTGSSPGDADFGPKDTWIVDLLMVTRRFNIDGYIATEVDVSFSSGDTPGTQNAQTKRDNLVYILQDGGTFTMTYDGAKSRDNNNTFIVNCEKISIVEIPGDEGTVTKYSVKFTVLEGTDMPARSS